MGHKPKPSLLLSDFLPGWEKPGLLSWSGPSTRNTLVYEVRDVLTILNLKREELRISIPLIFKSSLAPHVNISSLFLPYIHQPATPIYQEHREGLARQWPSQIKQVTQKEPETSFFFFSKEPWSRSLRRSHSS